ncbi:MAG: hypothetical protein GY729_03365 [Desulfobacteraceae bacterium]|nr:hypothetical protein [Desulfobacteraceae bacterium]
MNKPISLKAIFLFGIILLCLPGLVVAKGKPGAVVDSMKITTATATFDPIRPETARILAAAFQSIGWDVTPNPIEYNQNIQKVLMEHDYDMWVVMLSGASLRIDPDVFIYKKHFSEPLPVRTAVQAGLLYTFLVEVEMWAAKKDE